MTHICVGNLTIIGSDNGLSPGRRQAIIWTNAGIILTGPLGTNFNEILIAILTFSFKKIRLKVSSAKWRPFCLGINVLKGTRTLHISFVNWPCLGDQRVTLALDSWLMRLIIHYQPGGGSNIRQGDLSSDLTRGRKRNYIFSLTSKCCRPLGNTSPEQQTKSQSK